MLRLSRRPRPRGMSMVELMFVLVILAILVAMGTGQYRKMQVNNVFNNEVARWGAEFKTLGTLARSSGDLQPAALSTAINSSTSLGTAYTGRFTWRTWQDGKLRQSGQLGTRESLTVQFTTGYNYRQVATKGAYMDLCPVNAAGVVQAPVMQVIFKPDGSPVSAGDIRVGNKTKTYATHLSPMGAVDGPK